jgi:hypothetical protein
MIAFTKTGALRLIETKLGFPKPSPQYLCWYFRKEEGEYVPIVNFDALAEEVKQRELVKAMGEVVELSDTESAKKQVLSEIKMVIDKHII